MGLFDKRDLNKLVVELTSLVETSDVADAKRRLDLPMSDKESVDIAIATNMISVGLDITRLGMLHGAACHGCVLIAETSCEQGTTFWTGRW